MMHHRQTSGSDLPADLQEVHGSIMRIAEIGLDKVTMNFESLDRAVDRAFARAGFRSPDHRITRSPDLERPPDLERG